LAVWYKFFKKNYKKSEGTEIFIYHNNKTILSLKTSMALLI